MDRTEDLSSDDAKVAGAFPKFMRQLQSIRNLDDINMMMKFSVTKFDPPVNNENKQKLERVSFPSCPFTFAYGCHTDKSLCHHHLLSCCDIISCFCYS